MQRTPRNGARAPARAMPFGIPSLGTAAGALRGFPRRVAPSRSVDPCATAQRPTPCSSSGRSSVDPQGRDTSSNDGAFRRVSGGYKLGPDWLNDVPRMRMQTTSERVQRRKLEQLLEQAVMNERLSGRMEPWEARQRLEYLKMRRKNWELVYEYVTKLDVSATLQVIEDAYQKVEHALSEEVQESSSISDLDARLTELQGEVAEAREKLSATQSRVDTNLKRIEELRLEAEAMEAMRLGSSGVQSVPVAMLPATITPPAPARAAAKPAVVAPVPQPAAGPGPGSQGAAAPPPTKRAMKKGRAGLESSLDIEPGLKQFWYPVEFSAQLVEGMMVPFDMFGEPWVLFRDADGKPACVYDSCAHRACPLSLGSVEDGQVKCAYHGWKFDGSGACTDMPSTRHCKGVSVRSLPMGEKDGFVWVWPGEGEPPADLPDYTRPPEGHVIHAEIFVDVPVDHGLLMENLLDLAHAPFTHTGTFARGWPVPDAVKFHAQKLLSGQWDPYPISMAFQPPCMVLSHIGLAQPGKIERGVTADKCTRHLHQLHVCMPAKRGHTRLLYRMALDFMPWARYVPFIDRVWKGVAGQVLGEDLVLVLGQQDRLERGINTWNFPVSYDKIAVRYRRWRNQLAAGGGGDGAGFDGGNVVMSAGEMFELVDDEDADGTISSDSFDEGDACLDSCEV